MSARREAYRRSDLLLPHAHALEAAGLAENLGLHEMAHPIEEVQVSSARWGLGELPYHSAEAFPPSSKLKRNCCFTPSRVWTTRTCFCMIRLSFAKVSGDSWCPDR